MPQTAIVDLRYHECIIDLEGEHMRNITRIILTTTVAALMACALSACANGNASSSSSSQGQTETAPANTVAREDVEPVLHKAAELAFSSVSFTVRTESTATGAASNGAVQSQTMTTAMIGELDKSGEKPKMHIRYEAQSNTQLGKTMYDMYIDSENLIVNQNEQLYVDAMTDETLSSYADSVTSVISTEEIDSVLDMAASFKMEEKDGETTVSITVDKDKLVETGTVDASSLPENTSIATMVVSYSIGADDRFKAVRIMSSTNGTPTYRVHQSYQFSNYDAATLPAWPDLQSYIANQSGIQTDANGRMYIVGDDGQAYYITEIGDDGMIYYDTGGAGNTSETTYYETDPTAAANAGNAGGAGAGDAGAGDAGAGDAGAPDAGGEADQGRAYITADDGTVHFLDEEGSRLITNDDGSRYFIDADGNFYFLADE